MWVFGYDMISWNEIFRLFRSRSIMDDLNGIDNGADADPASLLREVMNTVKNLDN